VRQKFTGYEKDDESGLDFAQARMYANTLGRFTSVDPLRESARPENPQTWNRFSYSYNNPVRFTDPTGMIAGDFYSRNGTYLGTDGKKDNKIYLLNEGQESAADCRVGETEAQRVERMKNASTEVGGLIILTRTEEGSDYTIGEFKTVGGQKNVTGYMLEPAGPDTTTRNQDKRVPQGVFDLESHSGTRFKDTFVISNQDVPKDRAILFHSGNNGSHTEGCIMPGSTKSTGSIGGSKAKMAELKAFIKSEGASNVKFIIRNEIYR
jgi:RHS repeat-associated protein